MSCSHIPIISIKKNYNIYCQKEQPSERSQMARGMLI